MLLLSYAVNVHNRDKALDDAPLGDEQAELRMEALIKDAGEKFYKAIEYLQQDERFNITVTEV